jgi:hypothetical protein
MQCFSVFYGKNALQKNIKILLKNIENLLIHF